MIEGILETLCTALNRNSELLEAIIAKSEGAPAPLTVVPEPTEAKAPKAAKEKKAEPKPEPVVVTPEPTPAPVEDDIDADLATPADPVEVEDLTPAEWKERINTHVRGVFAAAGADLANFKTKWENIRNKVAGGVTKLAEYPDELFPALYAAVVKDLK